jgi:hypothetical protein
MLPLLFWMLRAQRAFNPALQAPYGRVLSKGAFTVVFWPEQLATPSHLPDLAPTSTAKRSTWWYRQWKRWRKSATPGGNGEAPGTPETLSISSFPVRPDVQKVEVKR